MNLRRWIFLAALAILPACRRGGNTPPPEPRLPVHEMQQGLDEARRRLEGLRADVRRLEKNLENASREARRDAYDSLAEIKERELIARIKLEELQIAAKKNWRAAREGAQSALNELENATRWSEQRLRKFSPDKKR
jgi:multidrug resistance efflux pump